MPAFQVYRTSSSATISFVLCHYLDIYQQINVIFLPNQRWPNKSPTTLGDKTRLRPRPRTWQLSKVGLFQQTKLAAFGNQRKIVVRVFVIDLIVDNFIVTWRKASTFSSSQTNDDLLSVQWHRATIPQDLGQGASDGQLNKVGLQIYNRQNGLFWQQKEENHSVSSLPW